MLNPEVMEQAVEELLRCSLAIGDGMPRIATRDTELGGQAIAKGDLVLVLVEGANYDPAAFPGRGGRTDAQVGEGACDVRCGTALLLGHPPRADPREHRAVRRPGSYAGSAPGHPRGRDRLRSGWIKRTPERLPVLWWYG
ncbi:cytochrome P450 [Streptomyces sp. URMC 126]